MGREKLKEAKRIVVKIGTSSLLMKNGKVNLRLIDELAFTLTDLRNRGKDVILVSSGAIGAGMGTLGLSERPKEIPLQQALAAVGQASLLNIYMERFSGYNQKIGQVLMTRDVIEYPGSRANAVNTFEKLLHLGLVPIVNENDTVAIDELQHETRFGDNDLLSVIVAVLLEADLLVMFSDIDGFYTANPLTHHEAKLIPEVHRITKDLLERSHEKGSKFGTGGMHSKLMAAKQIIAQDAMMVLTNGQRPKDLFEILAGKEIGTFFAAAKE
ncbi:glutamate 5-kinase [Enterococcus hirae]|jgi:glutamate 5-kinase|nr:glutamate 5-kinase [Enterococcaceae bacterium]MCI1919843.1 glutamate 5-kinase [Enterococcaceae bacterium]MDM8212649.1 glutamate 5-kinase [Enterococcus hirae]